MRAKKKNGAVSRRVYDSVRTREDIIAVATAEFAENGLSGARIERIASRTKTSKRGIYYYFGSKEKLYLCVLEEAYRRIRSDERALRLDHLPAREALCALVGFTFDYENAHPQFIRLVMNENIHYGKYLARSRTIRRLNTTAIDAVRRVLERGVREGAFRPGIDPVDLHMSISALCFFNVANRYTFSRVFKRDMVSAAALATRRTSVIATILASVAA